MELKARQNLYAVGLQEEEHVTPQTQQVGKAPFQALKNAIYQVK